MKKKKIIILSILVIFIIAMICGVIWYFNNRNSNYKPNGKLNYDTVLVNEETNPYYQVGFADYVFIGKVDKEIERTFSDYGSARTIYEIEVTENLKGDLQNIIKVTYPGGYDKDGTLILHKGDYITDEEFDTSQVDFEVSRNYSPVNHIIALGQGDLADRAVIHIFADENGGIQPYAASDTPLKDSDYITDESKKVLTGSAEIIEVLDISNAEITFGKDRIGDLQCCGNDDDAHAVGQNMFLNNTRGFCAQCFC